MIAFRLMNLP